FTVGSPSKSTRLNLYQWFSGAGFNVRCTCLPVCNPTPENSISDLMVLCLTFISIIIVLRNSGKVRYYFSLLIASQAPLNGVPSPVIWNIEPASVAHYYMEMPGFPPISYSQDRKSTRLNSSHVKISYAVICLKK